MKIEQRAFEIEELRMVSGTNGDTIQGYAAVFGSRSLDLGGFTEEIAHGAFTKTLGEADVRALFNHDKNYVIGRNKAGTLRMAEDSRGLEIAADLPDTTWAKDLRVSMERGDINQMSFGFRTIRDDWPQPTHRILREVALFDVSVVTYPAYPATTAEVRDWAAFVQAFDAGELPAAELRALADELAKRLNNTEQATPTVDGHLVELELLRRKLALM